MDSPKDNVWPWVVDGLLMIYVAWVARVLAVRVVLFDRIFRDFGADVPAMTSLTIKACAAPIPYIVAVFIGIALGVKNRTRISTTAKLGISVLVVFFILGCTMFVFEALFRPLLELIHRMSGS